MGMADAATVLFSQFLKFDPGEPDWPDRDRFVLSAGHGSMLLYSLLYLTGYPGITLDNIKHFRKFGSPCAGHPEYGHMPGIETTTGPLGQGIATAVGMALAERILNARFGDGLVDHKTYVIAGDGDLMEGVSHEAISLAGHLKLYRLIVLFDDNDISIDGPTSLADSTDTRQALRGDGWNTCRVDGHDAADVARALAGGANQRQARAASPRAPSSASARRRGPALRKRMAKRRAPRKSPARARSRLALRPVRDSRRHLGGLARDRRARQGGARSLDDACKSRPQDAACERDSGRHPQQSLGARSTSSRKKIKRREAHRSPHARRRRMALEVVNAHVAEDDRRLG